MSDKFIMENIKNEILIKDAIEKFKKNEKVDNLPISVGYRESTLILEIINKLGINIPSRTKGWINGNLIACWGNKKVKVRSECDTIYEILDEIKEKLNNLK